MHARTGFVHFVIFHHTLTAAGLKTYVCVHEFLHHLIQLLYICVCRCTPSEGELRFIVNMTLLQEGVKLKITYYAP